MNLKNRDFLKLLDYTPEEIRYLLDLAHDFKKKKQEGIPHEYLKGKNIALLFEKTSTRTRCAFEVAGYDLGMNVTFLDPVSSQMGKKESIEDTARVLCRMYDGIEYRGFSQTIVEELASRIAQSQVPLKLQNKRIISIDMATIVSGTKYRGEFEERMQKIIKEVETDGNIILFIDEIHTLAGAGGAEGAIDASNILKPALARGTIKCIGATTTHEYKKYIASDKALTRRFQEIAIKEPDQEQTIDILKKLKPIYYGRLWI